MNCKTLFVLVIVASLMVVVARAQEESGTDEPDIPKEGQVSEEQEPAPEPTPLPTPPPPVCLTTAQSNTECGVSRLRAFGAFAFAVEPRALKLNPQNSLHSCVETAILASAYDRFVNDAARAHSSESGASIFAGCESQRHAGHVCASELDNNTCSCLNDCAKVRALNSVAAVIANARNRGRLA